MPLKIRTQPTNLMPSLDLAPLQTYTLDAYAQEVLEFIAKYRKEYHNLARLQYDCGCRINELFQRDRWKIVNDYTLQIQPQKGNNLRVLQVSDLNYRNSNAMAAVFADMGRLPKGHYERCFSRAVDSVGLWRLYNDGFARPSSHFFRHLKVKKMAEQNFSLPEIAEYIGEKNVDNLNYYIDSQFFAQIR